MSEKSTPFTRAAAATLALLIIASIGWYKFQNLHDRPWRTGPDDGDNSHVVVYEVSSSALGISVDLIFFNGVEMVEKNNVLLPVSYEVVLKDGDHARVVAEVIQNSKRDGELDCDLFVDTIVAASDGDDLDRQYPNVECSVVI